MMLNASEGWTFWRTRELVIFRVRNSKLGNSLGNRSRFCGVNMCQTEWNESLEDDQWLEKLTFYFVIKVIKAYILWLIRRTVRNGCWVRLCFTKLYLISSPHGIILISDFKIGQVGSDSHSYLSFLPWLITTGL